MPSISRHLFEQLNVRKEKTGYYRLNESNAVVDCKTDHKIIAHSEDEKPVDCKIEKKPLEKPLTEGVSPDNPFLKAALDAYKNDDKAIGVVVSVKVKGNDEQINVSKLYHSDDEFENIKKELNDKYGNDIIDISAIHDRAKIKDYEAALKEECDVHEEYEDCDSQEVKEVEEVEEHTEDESLKEYLGDDNDPMNQVDEEEEYYERKEDELQDAADRLLDQEKELAWDELDWPDLKEEKTEDKSSITPEAAKQTVIEYIKYNRPISLPILTYINDELARDYMNEAVSKPENDDSLVLVELEDDGNVGKEVYIEKRFLTKADLINNLATKLWDRFGTCAGYEYFSTICHLLGCKWGMVED